MTKTAVSPRKKNRPNKNRSAAGIAGWLLLIAVSSCVMFVIGVVVGRNSAPVQVDLDIASLDRQIANLEKSVLAGVSEKKQNEPATGPAPEELDFFNALQEDVLVEKTGGRRKVKVPKVKKPSGISAKVAKAGPDAVFITDSTTLETRQEAASPAVQAEMTVASAETSTSGSMQQSDTQNSRAVDEKMNQKPPEPSARKEKAGTGEKGSIAPRAVPGGHYTIQVASLRDPEKARLVRDRFRKKGYPAYTQTAVVGNMGKWCRVRIGPYPSKKEAAEDLARLQAAGVDAILFRSESAYSSQGRQKTKEDHTGNEDKP